MEQKNNTPDVLDLLIRPGFCVKNNRIVRLNRQASSLMLTEGMDITPLLATGKDIFPEFQEGCLYLTLKYCGQKWDCTVVAMEDQQIFILEQEDQAELQAMALAAKELRSPLSNVITTADRLFPAIVESGDPFVQEQVARLNRGLYQMLRVVSNMSDAHQCVSGSACQMETVDIAAETEEIFSKAAHLIEHTGLTLSYTGLQENLFCLADRQILERAVFNIISNAAKFTPKGGSIDATLTRTGNMLRLSVQDSGSGIAEALRSSIHNRYLRQPAIEDSRFGIGLGMVLIRSAAEKHGGTVLIDHPNGAGTRVTMTLAVRQNPSTLVCCSRFRIDYAGERDHGLIELSDCLPASLYDAKEVN